MIGQAHWQSGRPTLLFFRDLLPWQWCTKNPWLALLLPGCREPGMQRLAIRQRVTFSRGGSRGDEALAAVSALAVPTQVPPQSDIPLLVHALAPMLGLSADNSTASWLWEHVSFLLNIIPLDHPIWESLTTLTPLQRVGRIQRLKSDVRAHTGFLPALLALVTGRQLFLYDWQHIATSTALLPASAESVHGEYTWFPPLCLSWNGLTFCRLIPESSSTDPFRSWLDPVLREPDISYRLPWMMCNECGALGSHEWQDCPCRLMGTWKSLSTASDPSVRYAKLASKSMFRFYSIPRR
jgi:hypothetical protein